MRFYGLRDAVGGYACVGPGYGSVAVFEGPVALIHVSNLGFGAGRKSPRSKQKSRSMFQRHCDILHHDGYEHGKLAL